MVPFLDLRKVTGMHASEIEEAVSRVVRSGWYLQGEENRKFEENYARFIGTRFAVGCGNGLDALILTFRALKELGKLHRGDEVIVPANTYIASILAVTETGLVPVLVEPDPATLQIDPARVEKAMTPRTRAMLIVHLYGRNAYNEEIERICREHSLLLVEDNAQAHGCRYGERLTGSLGIAGCHSFYPGKNLGALGDGGAVTTDDEDLARMVRTLANYGSPRKYVFDFRGRNSRLDEIQAAVLNVKLKYIDEDNAHRRKIGDIYYDTILHPEIRLPRKTSREQNVYHIFPILAGNRDELQQYLNEKGIQTIIHYPIPPHKQACYKDWNGLSLPVTEDIHRRELSLPMSPCMTEEEASLVAETLNAWNHV